MIAAYYKKTGAAREVLNVDEVGLPSPGAGELRVKLRASGINPADVKRRAGEAGRAMQFPIIIPHSDGAGVVDAVGRDVPAGREGQRVWLWNTQWRRPFGTAAEYVIVADPQAVPLPPAASFDLGASLGVPALTAYRSVSVLGPLSGRHVLVQGGAGMIGQFAIQFAKRRGALVSASVSSPEKGVVAREAGADHVMVYGEPDFVETCRAVTAGKGFDGVLDVDFAANADTYVHIVKRHGAVVVFGSASNMNPTIPILPFQVHGLTVHLISGSEQPCDVREAAIAEITQGIAEGWLTGRIEQRYPIEEVAAAHERVEAGRLSGKVVLTFGREG